MCDTSTQQYLGCELQLQSLRAYTLIHDKVPLHETWLPPSAVQPIRRMS